MSYLSYGLPMLPGKQASGSRNMENKWCRSQQVTDFKLPAWCLQAGEQPAHVGQINTYSSLRLEGKSLPSCLNSFPSFCESDLRSGNDRQIGLWVSQFTPANWYVFQVLPLVTHSVLSQLSLGTRLGNLLHKVLLLGECLWWVAGVRCDPGIKGNSVTKHSAGGPPSIYSATSQPAGKDPSLSTQPAPSPPPGWVS